MTTLTIKDLSRNEEMDRDGMADVRGGMLNLNFSRQTLVEDYYDVQGYRTTPQRLMSMSRWIFE